MNHLAVFAKFWAPGHVKTRLGQRVGMAAAAELHRAMLLATLTRMDQVADRRWIVVSPPESADAFRHLATARWETCAQVDGDLGRRMAAFSECVLARGARRVVLIGSDSPHVACDAVRGAYRALDTADVVLGPSPDGGYYLLGFREKLPPIFDQIEWGTSRVWQQTVDRLDAHQVTHHVIDGTFDVDRFEDLAELRKAIHGQRDDAPLQSLATLVDTLLGEHLIDETR